MPATRKDPGYGVTAPKDDSYEEHFRFAQEYLSAMYKKFGNIEHALAAYNYGPGNVDKWIKEGADINKLPAETRDYIAKLKPYAW